MTTRYTRFFKKFDQKNLRAKTIMDMIDKITEGHIKGVQYKGLFQTIFEIDFGFSASVSKEAFTNAYLLKLVRYAVERT